MSSRHTAEAVPLVVLLFILHGSNGRNATVLLPILLYTGMKSKTELFLFQDGGPFAFILNLATPEP
jgi:hypothetical protein